MKRSASYFLLRKNNKKYYKELFLKKIKNVKTVGFDRVSSQSFNKKIDDEIALIIKNIHDGKYKFVAYKSKLLLKGKDKFPRQLSIPTIRDRLVLKMISELLNDIFPEAKTELPQIKIKSISDVLTSNKFDSFIKIDIKNFYGTIPHGELLQVLKTRIRKKEILKLISSALKNNTLEYANERIEQNLKVGVPQGLSISNILAEIYIRSCEAKLIGNGNYFITRYVDDILILCKDEDLQSIINNIVNALSDISLAVHPFLGSSSKSSYGKIGVDSFVFLGYEFNYAKIAPRENSIIKFETSLSSVIISFKYKYDECKNDEERERCIAIFMWRLNLKISGCIYQGRRLGWVFYFSQTNTSTPFRRVDSTVRMIIKRLRLNFKIEPKKSLKAFYESRCKDLNNRKYIVNLDSLTMLEKRTILSFYLPKAKVLNMSDEYVNVMFSKKIKDALKDLERDVGGIS
ncbi:reverse transcriptase domain-containing protein [Rahnella aquatilis]|uniref:reverse transcriptase domain-containing protein n=1 Tax=Rahnella aquatilis TaxID=34038 RepID=UPI0006459828|nr:reverse transcriptase domain-containing protein [Rahnella aquatilis]